MQDTGGMDKKLDMKDPKSMMVLEMISRHCPQALTTFLQCLNRADNMGRVVFNRQTIEVAMSEDYDTFISNVKALARENLLCWSPLNGGVAIELAPMVDDE